MKLNILHKYFRAKTVNTVCDALIEKYNIWGMDHVKDFGAVWIPLVETRGGMIPQK